jgi:hypothetical protein
LLFSERFSAPQFLNGAERSISPGARKPFRQWPRMGLATEVAGPAEEESEGD